MSLFKSVNHITFISDHFYSLIFINVLLPIPTQKVSSIMLVLWCSSYPHIHVIHSVLSEKILAIHCWINFSVVLTFQLTQHQKNAINHPFPHEHFRAIVWPLHYYCHFCYSRYSQVTSVKFQYSIIFSKPVACYFHHETNMTWPVTFCILHIT